MSTQLSIVQLPNDVILKGVRRSEHNPFEHESVFYSPACQFTGTEREFCLVGFGYRYLEIDPYRRQVVLEVPLPYQSRKGGV